MALMRGLRNAAACAAAMIALLPFPARADWVQASSANFVIYADDSEKNVRRFAEQLERYHAAMARLMSVEMPPPSPSNRVSVYVVDTVAAVRRLHGSGSEYVQGFYVGRAGSSLAIVPRVKSASTKLDLSMIRLLHEYAHHFVTTTSVSPMPRWVSEGSAEYFSAAEFSPNGDVTLGRTALHRAYDLFLAKDVTATDLVDPDAYEKKKSRTYDAFYGKSWLLFHYLSNSGVRDGQLAEYLARLAKGTPSRAAAEAAFGDLAVLERELDTYLKSRRFMEFRVRSHALRPSAVTIRSLRAGEAAIMNTMIRSKVGVDKELAAKVLVQARLVAAQHPSEPFVLSALAEAEFDAGNDLEAIAAADRALAADPGQVNAYVQKGYALTRLARTGKDSQGYQKARKAFVALNRLENDHPIPLIQFYLGFLNQGLQPTPLAVQGLERAVELAPFDLGLRMTLARQQLIERRVQQAQRNLALVAYDPHGGNVGELARTYLDRVSADPSWDGRDGAVFGLSEEGESDES